MAYEIFDDNAFYWFLQTLLSISLLPFTIWRYIVKPIRDRNKNPMFCKCSFCSKKKPKKSSKSMSSKIFKKSLFLLLWAFYIGLIYVVRINSKQNDFVQFDPFKILDLETDSTPSQIKKRYYNLSLHYHPDKNPSIKKNSEELKKYILIKKAYETLTNDETRENYKKFGHPDGDQGISLTIGLPSFLTSKENEAVVLVIYFALLILLAVAVFFWRRRASKYNKFGVLKNTGSICVMNLTENSNEFHFLEILAMSYEFLPFNNKTNSANFERLFNEAKKQSKLSKKNYVMFVNYTWTILIHHFSSQGLPKEFQKDYLFIMSKINKILKSHYFLATDQNIWAHKIINKYNQDRTLMMQRLKNIEIPPTPIISLLKLSQHFCQKIWFGQSSLAQIPHFGHFEYKEAKRLRIFDLKTIFNAFQNEYDLSFNLSSNKSLNKSLNNNNKTNKIISIFKNYTTLQKEDLIGFFSSLPIANVTANISTRNSKNGENNDENSDETQSKICQFNVKIILKRSNFQFFDQNESTIDNINQKQEKFEKNEQKDLIEKSNSKNDKIDEKIVKNNKKSPNGNRWAHCPNFPFLKKENWYLMIFDTKQKKFLYFNKIDLSSGEKNVTVFFHPVSQGNISLEVKLISDCYVGLDFDLKINEKIPQTTESTKIEKSKNNFEDYLPKNQQKCQKRTSKIAKIAKNDKKLKKDKKSSKKSKTAKNFEKSESEEESEEMPQNLMEEEKNLFSFEWYDYLTLIIVSFIAYLILPKTEFGKKYISPLTEKARIVFIRLKNIFVK